MAEPRALSVDDKQGWGRRKWERYLHELWFGGRLGQRLSDRLKKHLALGPRGGIDGPVRAAGFNSQTVYSWVARPERRRLGHSSVPLYAPKGPLLRELLEARAIDPAAYQEYLAEWDRFAAYLARPKSAWKSRQKITVVCPDCGEERSASLVVIEYVQRQRRAKGLPEFPVREDGSVERLCLTCSLDKARAARQKPKPPAKRSHEQKTAQHREAISRAKILGARLERTLHLCPLDLQWHHRTRWHLDCARDWAAYRFRHPEAPPEPLAPARRGPSGALAVRNLQLLLKNEPPQTALDRLEAEDRLEIQFQPDARRALRGPPTLNAVRALRRRFLSRLPGSWRLFYSVPPSGGSRAERMAPYEKKLAILQEAIPVPKKLQPLINAGAKDAIIRRLYAFEVSPDRIAARIGDVDGQRTAHVIAAMTPADIERERTRGYRRTGTDIMRARIEAQRKKPEPRPRLLRRPINQKLTRQQAEEILAAPAERGANVRLAQQYGVTAGYISAIRSGRTRWTGDAGRALEPAG